MVLGPFELLTHLVLDPLLSRTSCCRTSAAQDKSYSYDQVFPCLFDVAGPKLVVQDQIRYKKPTPNWKEGTMKPPRHHCLQHNCPHASKQPTNIVFQEPGGLLSIELVQNKDLFLSNCLWSQPNCNIMSDIDFIRCEDFAFSMSLCSILNTKSFPTWHLAATCVTTGLNPRSLSLWPKCLAMS